MFFILSKILEFVIFPLTWVIILVTLALVFWKRKIAKKLIWGSLIILLFFSNTFIFNSLAQFWAIPHVHSNDIGKLDIAIVLGGMVSNDPTHERIHFNGNADRLLQALPALNEGQFKHLLISGGSGFVDFPDYSESKILKNYLESIGYPTENIWIETESRNTHQNAKFTKTILLTKVDIHQVKIGLITSQMHMRRALACFKKTGLNCIPYSTNPLVEEDKGYLWHEFIIPNIEIMQNWKSLMHEVVGFGVYKLKGYI